MKESEDTLFEKIKKIKRIITEETDEDNEILNLSETICPFNKGNPKCRSCIQPIEKLRECKEEYLDRIDKTPQEFWTPGFGAVKPVERERSQKQKFGMLCDQCYFSEVCPEYAENHTCSVDFGSDIGNEPKDLVDYLIEIQKDRITRAKMAELVDGGVPDQSLSGEIDRMTGLLDVKQDLYADKFKLSIEGSSRSGSQGGGILSQIFGKKEPALEEGKEPIVIEAKKIDDIEVPFTEELIEKPKKTRREQRDGKNTK